MRRVVIGIVMAVAVLGALAWGASTLSKPAGSAGAQLAQSAAPTPARALTAVPSRTSLASVPSVEPTRAPEPTATATLYVISAVEVAPRTLEAEVQPSGEPEELLPAAIGRVEIPALGINQPIVPVSWRMRVIDGQPVAMWDTVKGAVGYHRGSAGIGQPGNTVLTGHTRGDGLGEFQNLWELEVGDQVRLYDAQEREYVYQVESVNIIQEIGLTVEERQENARYLQPTDDTRVTLITCWPEWVYSHRVIVIAKPQ